MNVATRLQPGEVAPATAGTGIADCDIHPSPKVLGELYPYLEKRWQVEIETFGTRIRQGNASGPQFPKSQPDAARRDAWPPGGGLPGSDLAFMQQQHLDPNNIELGILNTIRPHPGSLQNVEFGTGLARALNQWQIIEWTNKDKRLKASIVVPYEDAIASAQEIDHWAGHHSMAQVLLLSRTREPLGSRRYWPIYEAAVRANLPIGVHAFGNGGHPVTSSGWPSFYMEDMVGHAQSCQALVSSMVLEGVFELFPSLRVVMIEAGFAWLPALAWRLDKAWTRLTTETPRLRRLPSEYIRDHIWLTTQPMEEPEPRHHLEDTIDWIGWDRLLFATDYPHWDYDDPTQCLPLRISQELRPKFFRGNAVEVYRSNA